MIKESVNLVRKSYHLVRQPKLNRSTAHVRKEYDVWWEGQRDFLKQASTLDDWFYMTSDRGVPSLHNVAGKLRNAVFDCDFYRTQVFDHIQRHFPHARSVTEYGCGTGQNLLFLKSRLSHLECYGYDLSVSGVEIGRKASEKFGVSVEFAQLDYVHADPSEFIFPITDIAFTVLSLEQLPIENREAIKNIHSRVRLGSLHIEPVPENYPFNYRGIMGRLYSWKMDYLRNFDRNIRSLGLTDISKELLLTAHNPLMFPSLYVLKK